MRSRGASLGAGRLGGPLRLLQSIHRRNRAKVNTRMAPRESAQQRKPSAEEKATPRTGKEDVQTIRLRRGLISNINTDKEPHTQ